jgi:hypothetical protein
MKILDENIMKDLSFPDFEIEKFEFSPERKILKIFIEGAWLNIDRGSLLGKGVLCFNDWTNLSISRFDPCTEIWSNVNELTIVEPLKDLCEIKFANSTVYLCGFGKQSGHWVEWKLQGPQMHAEFDV